VFAVPENWEQHYRNRGWTDPPDDFEGDPDPMIEQGNPEPGVRPRDEMEGGDSEHPPKPPGEAFSPGDLLDDHWTTVVSRIESGDADDRLDDVLAAEQSRDSPRDSVIEAISERQ
jgi:hypothetical protein